jgi:hypothetical protein
MRELKEIFFSEYLSAKDVLILEEAMNCYITSLDTNGIESDAYEQAREAWNSTLTGISDGEIRKKFMFDNLGETVQHVFQRMFEARGYMKRSGVEHDCNFFVRITEEEKFAVNAVLSVRDRALANYAGICSST